ncbi:hypothetical protein TVAG_118050 [Trichomonas vaginalis G3]|uniref:Uncharacterized protein n=1 Tax=Trichomonas vaginalis (strain ATCC PRA-98 / G3) TaxID=412133 RepID=A2EHZ2_TRIV3|nr:hypothetical protein TVAGG3_0230160 [Trichomonas vaginalis G3]EAY07724.1 hypothetical protein TVAG_118050 [Trichomonas vaginalis G3]KAI5552568.1 hypothetical protein TVAGG3_0230160 [Trichomonas vaginalis G3]|eukprot:XP_001319947.1 hypothetical protein [Trichomonas vaginalis G3]
MLSFLITFSIFKNSEPQGESELSKTINDIKSALNNKDEATIAKINSNLKNSIPFLGKNIKFLITKIEKKGSESQMQPPAGNSILFFPYSDINVHIKFLDVPSIGKGNVKGNFDSFDAYHLNQKTMKKTNAPVDKDGKFLDRYSDDELVLHFTNSKGSILIESLDFE